VAYVSPLSPRVEHYPLVAYLPTAPLSTYLEAAGNSRGYAADERLFNNTTLLYATKRQRIIAHRVCAGSWHLRTYSRTPRTPRAHLQTRAPHMPFLLTWYGTLWRNINNKTLPTSAHARNAAAYTRLPFHTHHTLHAHHPHTPSTTAHTHHTLPFGTLQQWIRRWTRCHGGQTVNVDVIRGYYRISWRLVPAVALKTPPRPGGDVRTKPADATLT